MKHGARSLDETGSATTADAVAAGTRGSYGPFRPLRARLEPKFMASAFDQDGPLELQTIPITAKLRSSNLLADVITCGGSGSHPSASAGAWGRTAVGLKEAAKARGRPVLFLAGFCFVSREICLVGWLVGCFLCRIVSDELFRMSCSFCRTGQFGSGP